MPIVPVTFASLRTPQSVADNKLALLNALAALGFPALSWETGSVPSGLVEVQASALTDFQEAEKLISEGGLNSFAEGEALTELANEVYDNQRQQGLVTIGYITLTDTANAGPYVFTATSVSFSIGLGSSIIFNGVADAVTGASQITVPKGGSVDIIIQAQSVGSAYNVGVGTITAFVRGVKPGVSVTNPSDWLSKYASAQQGTDVETDPQLRDRDVSKWGTLGTGSPEKAYRLWATTATEGFPAIQQVKKCVVYSNLDILDPGRVDVIVAGSAGPLGPTVVSAVQNYIAPMQIGGERIPETARAVVSSALGNSVAVIATLYVQATFNTPAFQTTVLANLQAYFADLPIGALVSRERIIEVLLYPAGTSSGVITDADMSSPVTDVQLAYNEVAVAVPTITFVSV